MIPIPTFDQAYIISDLHMGGAAGHRIFGHDELLSKFIDYLRDAGQGDCALVLNGDTVDFLAARNAVYFDPTGAIAKLDKIFSSFPKVWQSLKSYVGCDRRYLIVTLGNHDLELALPWVREHLLRQLTVGNPAARERILLSFDGAGFACSVGPRKLLCVHGNEVDTWNVTDYERLRRTASDYVQGRPVEAWTPNAGSKLVIDVMNDIKRKHAFIDLLKPEKEGAVRILMAMHPELKAKLSDIAGVAAKWTWNAARRAVRLLSDERPANATDGALALERIVAGETIRIDTDQLLDAVERDFKNQRDPLEGIDETRDGRLGVWSGLLAAVSGREPHRVAWEAVKELASDDTFAIYKADSDFEMIDALAGSAFDVVAAGHTHLARVVQRRKIGRGWYLNTGTWASLMRLKPEDLRNEEAFKPVYERLEKAETIESLGELAWSRPTVAVIQTGVDPCLRQVELRNGAVQLKDPE